MVSKNPAVSVIVTNYNGKKYLKKCFDSLLKQTYPRIELILADDYSEDGSVPYIKKNYPQVKIAANPKNSGLSVTSNNGASLARGKYLLFYNNDTIAFPDFISEMVKAAECSKNIGIVCPVQLPYYPKDDPKEIKDTGIGSDIYGYICLAKDAGHTFYPDAAIFIRADLFKKIKGFDPDFFLYGEDMDICWRVHLLGYKIASAKKAFFRHDSFCDQKEKNKVKSSYRRRYLVERQVINKILKYYKLTTLIWLLPKFLFYYWAEALFFLIIKLDPRIFFGVYLKAIFWNIGKMQTILDNRRYIQKIRKVDDHYITALMYKRYRKLDVARELGVPTFQ